MYHLAEEKSGKVLSLACGVYGFAIPNFQGRLFNRFMKNLSLG